MITEKLQSKLDGLIQDSILAEKRISSMKSEVQNQEIIYVKILGAISALENIIKEDYAEQTSSPGPSSATDTDPSSLQ